MKKLWSTTGEMLKIKTIEMVTLFAAVKIFKVTMFLKVLTAFDLLQPNFHS